MSNWIEEFKKIIPLIPNELTLTKINEEISIAIKSDRKIMVRCHFCNIKYASFSDARFNVCSFCKQYRKEEKAKQAKQARIKEQKYLEIKQKTYKEKQDKAKENYFSGKGNAYERFNFVVQNYVKDTDYEYFIRLSYPDFLITPYWKAIRDWVLTKHNYRCQLCNERRGLHVHHKTYENHGREHDHLEDLITLCHNCHGKIHEKEVEKPPGMWD